MGSRRIEASGVAGREAIQSSPGVSKKEDGL